MTSHVAWGGWNSGNCPVLGETVPGAALRVVLCHEGGPQTPRDAAFHPELDVTPFQVWG